MDSNPTSFLTQAEYDELMRNMPDLVNVVDDVNNQVAQLNMRIQALLYKLEAFREELTSRNQISFNFGETN
jgi:uncharacterized protein YlxW (UPF0749 family)